MARIFNTDLIKNTRLHILYSLVFLLLAACNNGDKQAANAVEVIYTNGKATAIKFPADSLQDVKTHPLRVITPEGSDAGILGTFNAKDGSMYFEPAMPLRPGQTYSVLQGNVFICKVRVTAQTSSVQPKLLHIYPETDTLPENALKIYLHFATPMRTGSSLEHILLLDKNRDTLHRVFLNLQPELWDTTGTILTLWIDPGRIKRDLVLNRELGNPLKKSQSYQLVINADWKDSEGNPLPQNYTKNFVAAARDDENPDINQWQLHLPKAGTNAPLTIQLKETFDHYLLNESVTVLGADNKPVSGSFTNAGKDKALQFTPTQPWAAQNYKLQVAARLEDLAGNNLNRVFDRDITKEVKKDNAYYTRVFVVK